MFALKPTPQSRCTPPVVILSAASRDPFFRKSCLADFRPGRAAEESLRAFTQPTYPAEPRMSHVFILATHAECALTQKRGEGVGRAKAYLSRVSKVGGICLACSATPTHPYKRPFTAPFGSQGKRAGHPETQDGCIRAATRWAQ